MVLAGGKSKVEVVSHKGLCLGLTESQSILMPFSTENGL